mmetsp:Transcript_93950/g.287475  ORF Transcript_93950/g.287475 Transcript_93950/m.287475 type:complete len:207 (-) Transcript_93950:1590-2210(-)
MPGSWHVGLKRLPCTLPTSTSMSPFPRVMRITKSEQMRRTTPSPSTTTMDLSSWISPFSFWSDVDRAPYKRLEARPRHASKLTTRCKSGDTQATMLPNSVFGTQRSVGQSKSGGFAACTRLQNSDAYSAAMLKHIMLRFNVEPNSCPSMATRRLITSDSAFPTCFHSHHIVAEDSHEPAVTVETVISSMLEDWGSILYDSRPSTTM